MVAADLQLVNGKQRFVLKIKFAPFGMETVINIVVTNVFQIPGISFELLVPIADPAAFSRLLVRRQDVYKRQHHIFRIKREKAT